MIMEKYITQNGIKYELKGEQYYPMLEISEQEKHKIGKYGLLHRDYINQRKRGTYTTLLTGRKAQRTPSRNRRTSQFDG